MLRAMIALTRHADPDAAALGEAPHPDVLALRSGLAEYPAEGETAYVLRRGSDGALRAEPIEVDAITRFDFPFIKPNGSQSAQLGPVLTRSLNAKREVSPGLKILSSTMKAFRERVARGGAPAVYTRALEILGEGSDEARATALLRCLETIQTKGSVRVSIGEVSGADASYAKCLLDLLRAERYQLDPEQAPATCGTCGASEVLCANGLRGAGINFVNSDNHGKFAGLKPENMALRFAVCVSCADALRSFKTEVAPSLKCLIAGESALVIPAVYGPSEGRALPRARAIVEQLRRNEGVANTEERLLKTLEAESSVAAFHVLWAVLGQDLDEVTGLVTEVPRTRLAALSAMNQRANAWCVEAPRPGSVLPRHPLRDALFDLHLSWLRELLHHPGGARVKRHNQGQSLAASRRALARAVYTEGRFTEETWFRLLRETAASYLREALERDERGVVSWLQREDDGASPAAGSKRAKPRARTLTCAGWIRHAALCTRYLQHLKVIDAMSEERYLPERERLRPFFQDSGICGDAQAFAFLLGALWGKLVSIQAARKVNVKANALSWLRRGALCGDDLPRLFAQTRMKLLEYDFYSEDSAEVLHELARLGARLGDRVALDNDRTMYFLLLGQACAGELMPSKDKNTP